MSDWKREWNKKNQRGPTTGKKQKIEQMAKVIYKWLKSFGGARTGKWKGVKERDKER